MRYRLLKGTRNGGRMMEWQELVIDSYGRILEILESALEGLTQDDLNVQPHSDSNSIGWLVWHLTRVQDDHIADLMGEEQLWIEDEWQVLGTSKQRVLSRLRSLQLP